MAILFPFLDKLISLSNFLGVPKLAEQYCFVVVAMGYNQIETDSDMMELREKRIQNAARVGTWGFCLLVLSFFAPYAGQQEGKSFFALARASSWGNPGDWLAAWCSVKVVLVALGFALVIDSVARLMMIYRRETASWIVSLLNILPGMVMLLGAYYFTKAIF